MGYCANSESSDFLILPENMAAVAEIVRRYYGEDSARLTNDIDLIDDAFASGAGLTIDLDTDHNGEEYISGLYFEFDKYHDADIKELFDAIKDYVEPGSYISFAGEDDCFWSFYFDDVNGMRQVSEFKGRVIYDGMPEKRPDRKKIKR